MRGADKCSLASTARKRLIAFCPIITCGDEPRDRLRGLGRELVEAMAVFY
jgi:hypothetical protein